MVSDMPNHSIPLFIKRFFVTPAVIGTIAPTSTSTARKMAAPIPPNATVLEIGAGTGSMTQGILERLDNPSQLTSVEIDPELAKEFRVNFPNVTLNVGDAEEVMRTTSNLDAIVSGIPFAVMDAQKRTRMFQAVARAIKPDGLFIPIQYGLTLRRELEQHFSDVRIGFSFWNIPPTFFYICRKPKTTSSNNR